MPTSSSDSQAQFACTLTGSSFQFSEHTERAIFPSHLPSTLKFVFRTNELNHCHPSSAQLMLTKQVTNSFGSSSRLFAQILCILSEHQSNQRMTQVVLLFFWLHLTVITSTISHKKAFILSGRNLPLNVRSCAPQVYFLHNC